MKILFISSAKDIHTCRWVNELINQGHQVDLVYCSNHDKGIHTIDSRVRCYKLPFPSGVGYYLNIPFLKRIVKYQKPDIVNAHYASGYGTLLRYLKFKRSVVSVWGADVYDFPYKNKLNMKIIKKNLLSANAICSTSNSMADQVKKLIQANDNIYITPFGVDAKKFEVKKEYFPDRTKIRIGIVKRLEPKYGIKYLIEAVKLLIENNPQKKIILDIYGDGNDKEKLILLAKKLEIEGNVNFYGSVENSLIPHILAGFDIFSVSSILDSESFGVSVVEAMATGLPVVATDVSGFKEVIDNSINGLIVSRKNPESLFKAMQELIDDPEQAVNLGKMARKKVLDNYNFSDNVNYMTSIYGRIINGG